MIGERLFVLTETTFIAKHVLWYAAELRIFHT